MAKAGKLMIKIQFDVSGLQKEADLVQQRLDSGEISTQAQLDKEIEKVKSKIKVVKNGK